MIWALIVILIVTVGVFFWERSRGNEMSIWLMLCVVAALVTAIISLFQKPATLQPPVEALSKRQACIGYALARAVAEDLPEGGDVAVIQWSPNGSSLDKVLQAQVQGIREGFKGTPLRISGEISPDDESLNNDAAEPGLLPSELFERAMSENVAMISLIGLPSKKVKIPVYSYPLSNTPPSRWKAALKRGMLEAVVIGKPLSEQSEVSGSASLQDHFDAAFELKRR